MLSTRGRPAIILAALASVVLATAGAAAFLDRPRPSGDTPSRPVNKPVLALVITHLGPEDRPVAALVLHAEAAVDFIRKNFRCGTSDECRPLPRDAFAALVAAYRKNALDRLKDDPRPETDLGSFRFETVADGAPRTSLSLNPRHSAEALDAILRSLPPGPARASVERRLNIARSK